MNKLQLILLVAFKGDFYMQIVGGIDHPWMLVMLVFFFFFYNRMLVFV